MTIQQMLLGAGVTLRLTTATIQRANTGGATASFRLDADGQVYIADDSSGGVATARYNWVTPTSAAANYDCFWTTTSGTLDTNPGAESTNLALTSDRSWTETNGAGLESASFSVSIRSAGGSTNLATATITLEVDGS